MFDHAIAGDGIQNRDAIAHFMEEFRRDRLVHGDDVFLFVVVARPQDFIDNIAVARQENQPFAGFIEAPDGENSLRIID